MGQIETLFSDIISASLNYANDGGSRRTSEEYYKYGQKYFHTNEGQPPQIRVRPTSFNLKTPEKIGTNTVTGSLSSIYQNVEITIWGQDEDQCFSELSLLTAGINYIKGTLNSEVISQPPAVEVINGEWSNTSNHLNKGEMLNLNYRVKINLKEPSGYSILALINSASITVSGSSAVNSGSYQGSKYFVFTSSSY
jgi:hypothetical protein